MQLRAGAEVLPSWVHSYVAGGAGDGNTQRASSEDELNSLLCLVHRRQLRPIFRSLRKGRLTTFVPRSDPV